MAVRWGTDADGNLTLPVVDFADFTLRYATPPDDAAW